MIPHTQQVLDDKTGDCFATCLACLLELPLNEVPNFKALQEQNNNYDMVVVADKWLRENHKKRIISIEMYNRENTEPLTEQPLLNRVIDPNDLVILSGESPRKKANGDKRYHAVIAKPQVWGYELVHDPHPDRAGIVGQPYGVMWLVGV